MMGPLQNIWPNGCGVSNECLHSASLKFQVRTFFFRPKLRPKLTWFILFIINRIILDVFDRLINEHIQITKKIPCSQLQIIKNKINFIVYMVNFILGY